MTTAPAPRDGSGRFVKGYSGNPGGKRAGLVEVRALASEYTVEAVEMLVHIMRSGKYDRDRAASAMSLLEIGYGKLTQPPAAEQETAALTLLMELRAMSRRERDGRVVEGAVVREGGGLKSLAPL